ncbi:hypothetical protein CHLRE_01g003300v5 [Chlamydomonas reinhardtii]|uniref:Leucine-binding protein domain-containing protein n=1 Tax=Chlamydomonas reinhardtii TaxID=3055 RepID=A8JD75_CHLRE|nr:uncharacterized protein CHLRE_01g003300v5 [Chlamydomonas reinhardtii]PNW87817.1 hypothetical protein CHLRE_01g003300v5 [Chlamydomonas reinhardtii]|eukprot:XP_001700351.1 predicted protein [Chlamydomonas reinhardtii]
MKAPMLAAALLVALLAGSHVAAQPRPIKVGVFTFDARDDPTTLAESVSFVEGSYMAIADRGYKVNTVTSPAGCDTDNIAKEVERLVKEEKVVAIIGPICSGAVLAAAPTINALKVPAITASGGALAISTAGPYIYRSIPNAKTYLFTLMNYLAPMFPTMAILYDDSILGLDFKNLATQYYTAKGGKVVSSVMFAGNSTTAHVEDLTKQAAAAKPSLLFYMATSAILPELEGAFIKAARAADPKLPIVMPNGFDVLTKQEFEVVGANGTKSYPALGGIYTSGDVIFPKANARYSSMFGIDTMPTLGGYGYYATAYDAMSAIITAAQESGYNKLKNVNKMMSAKSFTFRRYNGMMGKFDENGDIIAEAQVQQFSAVTGDAEPIAA